MAVMLTFPSAFRVFGNWGIEVGRASPTDAVDLVNDWNTFKRARFRINDALLQVLPVERQKQMLGLGPDDRSDLGQLAEAAQQYWMREILGPLQRVALNPAASCAEAQFAGQAVQQMERQRQLIGLAEDATLANVLNATLGMVSLRCREEALDECVATGRFQQIIDMMTSAERQAQLLGREDNLENWAEDALRQCAIYELHFISKTKGGHGPMALETVRDGRIPIKLETPPGGLKTAIRTSLGDILKGETAGGNNPFFVSVKCSPPTPAIELICSPGANSTAIKVRINALEMKHKEFYIGHEKPRNPKHEWEVKETEVTKQRVAGSDLFGFDFEGGMFSLQGVVKAPFNTVSMPFPDWGNTFYMAHKKDMAGGPRSGLLRINAPEPVLKQGVYPVILQFTYADQNTFGNAVVADSTEFELIHKPKPKPFPQRGPSPIRRTPLRPRPGE